MTTVSVFGGTGFLGRRLVRRLASEGTTVRVAVRHADRARSALHAAGLDRVSVFGADVRDQATVAAVLAGADAVVDAVSAYVETRGVTFEAVHEQGAKTIAREAAAAGVARFVLVSGIGADPESGSPYIRARGRGERAVQQVFPGATIVRPSAMFGPGDALFGTLAHLARLLPVLPLIGGGRMRMQPVYVEDVAEAIAHILADPGAVGRTYELAGPTVYTLREIFIIALRIIGKRRLLVPVPFAVAEVQARLFELLPNPPLTSSQVDLLKADNVASGTLPGLRELNVLPKAIEVIVSTYLADRASTHDWGVVRLLDGVPVSTHTPKGGRSATRVMGRTVAQPPIWHAIERQLRNPRGLGGHLTRGPLILPLMPFRRSFFRQRQTVGFYRRSGNRNTPRRLMSSVRVGAMRDAASLWLSKSATSISIRIARGRRSFVGARRMRRGRGGSHTYCGRP